MIRRYGKLLTQKDCEELITYSPTLFDSNRDFYQCEVEGQWLDSEVITRVTNYIRTKVKSKLPIVFDLISVLGRVDEHTDRLYGLSQTCFLVPLKLPRDKQTYLFEEYKDVTISRGYMYSFNQHRSHGIGFFNNEDSYCRTIYLAGNLKMGD